ncbi:hypothetical protein [Pelagibacterium luteolum]|uniref:Uncharacterized protein n=1 Tax=Pelagibacterium luteolum TaxID=440168 RepID=A0A1G7ZIV9_9HYPH|nr:hypothetical protein [Pelagibacterium luteolum]SDH08486.1 hypothetical protein SAMN04487974_12037 [Pelagibacterium luteolum]
MAKMETVNQQFNVGVIDKEKLHRQDLLRVQIGAEVQTNLLGAVTGEMFMRPGFEYLAPVKDNDRGRIWAYYRSDEERAILEFTDETMRVWVEDELLTRTAVSATVTNGDFSSGTGWVTSASPSVLIGGGMLQIAAVGKGRTGYCRREVTGSNPGVEHALRIVVTRGPVTFKVGGGAGSSNYFGPTVLGTGVHSVAFTPVGSGNFWVEFSTDQVLDRAFVDSIQIEAAGVVEIPTPWTVDDLSRLRLDPSLDVIFAACPGHQQRRIERRGQTSWSVTKYQAFDGPFASGKPFEGTVTDFMGTNGLQTSTAWMQVSDVGGLIRTFSERKEFSQRLAAGGVYTDPIRVTGVNATDYNDREFSVSITGTWSGTLKTFRSFDGPDFGYRPFRREAPGSTIDITANASFTNDDDDDNAIVWYRVGFEPGDYTSGVALVGMEYAGDQAINVFEIETVNPTTQLTADVAIRRLEDGDYETSEWEVSDWPFVSGWPTAVSLHEGRLFWSGRDKLWGSISDAFDSFDDSFEGEAGPINRAIATSGSNEAQWMLSLEELVIGTGTSVVSARASSQGEILTPDSLTIKVLKGSIGCAPIGAVQIGNEGLFVDATRRGIFLVRWTGAGYAVNDISKLTKSIFSAGIVELAVQRSPDPRVWAALEDGNLACVLYDPDNEVLGFFLVETTGAVESVTVQQSTVQDRVYASIRREVDGETVRYFEKMALDSEVKPSTLCKTMDSFAVLTPTGTLISGLDHLEGETVVAWAAGGPIVNGDGSRREFVVTGGNVSLPAGYENTQTVLGLPYRGRYKSGRLGSGVEGYSPTMKRKRLVDTGLLMTDFVRSGVKFGSDFDALDDMPSLDESGAAAQAIVLNDVRDEQPFPVDDGFDLDSRVCVEVNSPFTAKFLAMRLGIETV